MGTEIEKKYRLMPEQRETLSRRLRQVGATLRGREFEVNTLYTGGNLDTRRQVLRVRRINDEAILTYKERSESSSAIKQHREDETRVEDAAALGAILEALGYKPSLVYEKSRATWHIKEAEVVLDELPFGLFLEIEGEEAAIREVEGLLNLENAEAEMATYPELTEKYGVKRGEMIEARFQMQFPEI